MRAVKERDDKIVITAPASLTEVDAALTDLLNFAIIASVTDRSVERSQVSFDQRWLGLWMDKKQ